MNKYLPSTPVDIYFCLILFDEIEVYISKKHFFKNEGLVFHVFSLTGLSSLYFFTK